MEQWQLLSQRFEQMTSREQGMVLLATLFVVGFVLFTLGLEPAMVQAKQSQQRLTQMNQTAAQLEQQIEELGQSLRRDPNEAIRKELKSVQQQVKLQEQRLGELTHDLISPSNMLPVLRELLQQTAGVRLIALSSKPPVPEFQDPERPELAMYRHSLELRIEADYFQVYELLKAIEKLPWHFYWLGLNYKVSKYPKAEVQIELYTLSTSEDYIRV